MTVIDADAHVIESERTWDYLEAPLRQFRPVTVQAPTASGGTIDFWYIDGRFVNKGPVSLDEVTKAIREMEDIPGRLRHMDEMGVDIQVLFPTAFLRPGTNRPEVELALCRSYNRWLADIWKRGQNRLRWAVVLPLMSMAAALEELRFAKDNGACAVFMRCIEGDRLPTDAYYAPLFQEASALNMPICIHAATGNFWHHDLFPDDPGFWRFKLSGVNAFHSLVFQGIPERFPNLRFGFIELSSQWVPYVIHDIARRFEKQGKRLKRELLREYRLYVACQTDDDIPYVLEYAGEDSLVIGTDYGHADTSSELAALTRLQEMPGIAPKAAKKILGDNARALYGL